MMTSRPALKYLFSIVICMFTALPPSMAVGESFIGMKLGHESHHAITGSSLGPTVTFEIGYEIPLSRKFRAGATYQYTPVRVFDPDAIFGPFSELSLIVTWLPNGFSGPFLRVSQTAAGFNDGSDRILAAQALGVGYALYLDIQTELIMDLSYLAAPDARTNTKIHAERLRFGTRYRF